MRVVIDTNVLVAAFRSKQGASFEVLRRVGTGDFEFVLSVGLVLEYEEQLMRIARSVNLARRDVDDVLSYLCAEAVPAEIYFLWRPTLKDADDDMLLEAAVAGQCDAIVTHNVRDFRGADRFGLSVLTPGAFLKELRS